MGAWDIRVLQNDAALDAMYQISKRTVSLDTIRHTLSDEEIDVKIIGIAMVVTAIEKDIDMEVFGSLYDYEQFFKQFTTLEINNQILQDAQDALAYVRKHDYNWFGESKQERIDFLDRLSKILYSYEN